jgi:hypothetical protein
MDILQNDTKNYDLTSIIKKEHEGKWVALSADYTTVVDFADTPHELKEKVGSQQVVFMRALPTSISYAF